MNAGGLFPLFVFMTVIMFVIQATLWSRVVCPSLRLSAELSLIAVKKPAGRQYLITGGGTCPKCGCEVVTRRETRFHLGHGFTRLLASCNLRSSPPC